MIVTKLLEFVRVYDRTIYLTLFGPEKHDTINKKIRYLMSQKCGNTYFFLKNYARIKIESNDSLPLEKTLTLHNVIILISLVFKKNKSHYYYHIFLEKCSYRSSKNKDNNLVFV